jgi:cytoskeletal protein RodZ
VAGERNGSDEPEWHDQQPLIMAAGVAALILIAILIYAVMRTSDSSHAPPPLPVTSSSDTPQTYTTPTTTTSYTVPRVTTSEDNPIVPGSTPPLSSTREESPDTTSEDQTFTNPYPTTTPTNAGHF